MKRVTKKESLGEKVEAEYKRQIRERKLDALKEQSRVKGLDEKGRLLQIRKPKRVNLHITPELYEEGKQVADTVMETYKLNNDPLSAKFWYDLLVLVNFALEIIEVKKKNLDEKRIELEAEYERYRIQNK